MFRTFTPVTHPAKHYTATPNDLQRPLRVSINKAARLDLPENADELKRLRALARERNQKISKGKKVLWP